METIQTLEKKDIDNKKITFEEWQEFYEKAKAIQLTIKNKFKTILKSPAVQLQNILVYFKEYLLKQGIPLIDLEQVATYNGIIGNSTVLERFETFDPDKTKGDLEGENSIIDFLTQLENDISSLEGEAIINYLNQKFPSISFK